MPEPGAVRPNRNPYGWRGLAGDAAGGTVAALIALPYGLAMAQLMGLPPGAGPVHVNPDGPNHGGSGEKSRAHQRHGQRDGSLHRG